MPGADAADRAPLPVGKPLPGPVHRFTRTRFVARNGGSAAIAAPDLVYVPAATFAMGNPYSHLNEGYPSELPLHNVALSPFLVGRTEVPNDLAAALLQSAYDRGLLAIDLTTNGIPYAAVSLESTNVLPLVYLQGLTTNVHISFSGETSSFVVREGKEKFPAIYVTRPGALAMANFLSDALGLPRAVDPSDWSVSLDVPGFRIPTEAEWERAARGDPATYPTHFPWPNDSVHGGESYAYSIDPWKANYTDFRFRYATNGFASHPRHPWFDEPVRTTPVAWYDGHQTVTNDGYVPSAFVGADYGRINDMANSIGLYDMAGNVAEWCIDYYYESYTTNCYAGYADDPVTNPCVSTPAASNSNVRTYHVFRGGAWTQCWSYENYDSTLQRCSYRLWCYPDWWAEAINGFRLARPLSPYETWAAAHFDSPLATDAGPDADPDADAFPNASEYVAGTDPTNSASRLYVSSFAADSPSVFSLTFPAVSGRVYAVETALPSSSPDWTPALPSLAATSTAPLTVSLPSPAPTGSFIRITIPR